MNKRGLSSQIQVVLIIVGAIALAALLAFFINSALVRSGSSISAEVLVMQSRFSITAAVSDGTKLDVTVKRDEGTDTFPTVTVRDSEKNSISKGYEGPNIETFQTATISFLVSEMESAHLKDISQIEVYSSTKSKTGELVYSRSPTDTKPIAYSLAHPQSPVCGNNIIEQGEICDDHNTQSCDGCSADCQIERCGNGQRECSEICDDGNTNNNDQCNNNCQPTFCGDSLVQTPNGNGQIEVCDDGNTNNNDQCNNNCQLTICGDNIIQNPNGHAQNEICDDGNSNNNDACSSNCQLTFCGDGITQAPNGHSQNEICDDGNSNNNDQCTTSCALTYCGDSVIQIPNGAGFNEQCDNGPDNSNTLPNHCRTNCINYHCGDGVCDSGEGSGGGAIALAPYNQGHSQQPTQGQVATQQQAGTTGYSNNENNGGVSCPQDCGGGPSELITIKDIFSIVFAENNFHHYQESYSTTS